MYIKVREIRESRGLSMKELARLSGVSKSAISLYERNEISPTLDVLECIAKALEVPITDLFESEVF